MRTHIAILIAGMLIPGVASAQQGAQFQPPGGLPTATPVGTGGDTLGSIMHAASGAVPSSAIGQPNGVPSLDGNGNVTAPVSGDVSNATIGGGAQTVQGLASPDIGTTWSAEWERQTVAAGGTLTLASITNGPGYAQTINIAAAGNGIDVDKSTVSFFVDGEATASVVLTLGELGTYGANQFHTRWMSSQSSPGLSGITFRLPAIPYSKSLTAVLTNNGSASFTTWGWIAGNHGGAIFWDRKARMHTAHLGGQYSTAAQAAPFAEQTLLDVNGRGQFWGMTFFVDFQNNVTGGNNNAIEGNVKYYLNGNLIYESSGLEDYFLSAFAFQSATGTYPGPLWASDSAGIYYNTYHGESDATTDAVLGLWRWNDLDPVQFDGEFKVTWTPGDPSNTALTPATKARLAVTAFYSLDH